MLYWSLLFFIHIHLTYPPQPVVNNGQLRIQVPSLETHAGMIPCTIYNGQNQPVRIIPLEGGHRKGVYTIRLHTLPEGEYSLQCGAYQTNFRLSRP
ncbi:hypothetical protein [Chitinophaga sp.]|uniref:hypothetical protein n=1 Tax=Chitinophaga sp. TaxID=1869181 RepID=UPI00262CBAF1|nr:hypothetical protein [uncultured Chitinophaga sp.]